MADRKPIRQTVEDLANPPPSPQQAVEPIKNAQSPKDSDVASQNLRRPAQPGSLQTSGLEPADLTGVDELASAPGLSDEDTIEGELRLVDEVDTQTVFEDDPLANIDLDGGAAAGFDFAGLDLADEIANLEAAAGPTVPGKVAASGAGVSEPVVSAVVVSAPGVAKKKDKQTAASDAASAGKDGSKQDAQTAETSDAAAPLGLPRKSWRERLLLRSVPSWLISMMLHVALLMTLAAIQLEPVREAMGVLLTADAGEDAGTTLEEEFNIRGPDLEQPVATTDLDQTLSTAAPSEFASEQFELPESTNLMSAVDSTNVDVGSISSAVEGILPSSALNAATARMSSSLSGRLSGAMKSEMLERFGGNAASEKSVSMALKWIAEHQDRSGGWTFGHSHVCRGKCQDDGDLVQATNAATALALLPFLGAGQTHLEGNYKTTVHNGLKFLISRMKVTGGTSPMGSWLEEQAGGNMYSHGLASIVVCEAYAMTRDPDLLQPAQLALNYIVYAQDPRGGGWRYKPKQPGDTSVVGWQLMALKSGAMGNLVVPQDTFRKANSFLDSMAVNDGAYYGYDQPTSKIEGRQSTTAVGLLCRMYLGWTKDHPGLQEGVKYLSSRGPSVEDLYYSYYATQVLRQYGGPEWEKWNKAMRDGLINAQVKEGHAAGSWYSPKSHNLKGGRLYCTAMSAMILEVYYRHMPLYSEKSSDDDFEL